MWCYAVVQRRRRVTQQRSRAVCPHQRGGPSRQHQRTRKETGPAVQEPRQAARHGTSQSNASQKNQRNRRHQTPPRKARVYTKPTHQPAQPGRHGRRKSHRTILDSGAAGCSGRTRTVPGALAKSPSPARDVSRPAAAPLGSGGSFSRGGRLGRCGRLGERGFGVRRGGSVWAWRRWRLRGVRGRG